MKLKALVVSDHESEYIWDYFNPDAFHGVELMISCGDLRPEYLSFLVTMIHAPLIYVRGNHDARYKHTPPDGCIDLEKKPYLFKSVRFIGFGGCKSPKAADNNYTEREMEWRVRRAVLPLEIRKKRIDVLVTHAPAKGLGDGQDRYHEGFVSFRKLIDRCEPRYHLHGHQHLTYNIGAKRVLQHNGTTIVNGYNYCILDMEFPEGCV
jgi:Icc-related predicted phosphoesterase